MLRLKAALILVILSLTFTASAQEGKVHVVLPGESFYRIAQDYGVDVDTIAHANNITNTWRIDVGQQLIIPDPNATPTSEPQQPASADVEQPVATSTPQPTEVYTVGYGQSLQQIAVRFGMTVDQLAQLNDITNPNLIYAGQKLLVPSESGSTPAQPQPQNPPQAQPTEVAALPSASVTHVVQRGETLASIAQSYGISWLQIAQANNIYDANYISAGQELVIPGVSAPGSTVDVTAAPPARIGMGKEIIVDLSDERTYAYQDGKLIRNVLSSTGLPGTPTVKGDFTIQRKYIAQTMTGPGYYLPDVPYVMYFYAGYALHGTYWHNNFGHPMSHGCVNLPTSEAQWFYDWTEIGTPVHVES